MVVVTNPLPNLHPEILNCQAENNSGQPQSFVSLCGPYGTITHGRYGLFEASQTRLPAWTFFIFVSNRTIVIIVVTDCPSSRPAIEVVVMQPVSFQ